MSTNIGYINIEGRLDVDKACAAKPFAGGFECERCALAWDRDVKPPPCETLTYTRLVDVVINEAFRIEATQEALVKCGDRDRRHCGELKRAMELRAVAKLIGKYQDEQAARQ